MQSPFETYSPEHVRRLIAEHPLAWLLPAEGGITALSAARLPLLADFAEDGTLLRLVGHLSRRNPLIAALGPERRAVALFAGPQGYVSPAQAGLRDWGPTWNYAQVAVDCVLDIDAELTESTITRLVETMEHEGTEPAWRASELGARYAGMRERIIGFHATVTGVTGRFKLGQDERPEVLDSIIAHHPDAALTDWMRGFREPPR